MKVQRNMHVFGGNVHYGGDDSMLAPAVKVCMTSCLHRTGPGRRVLDQEGDVNDVVENFLGTLVPSTLGPEIEHIVGVVLDQIRDVISNVVDELLGVCQAFAGAGRQSFAMICCKWSEIII